MFRSACLKLTGFYVLMVMGASLFITPWVYTLATRELKQGLFAVHGSPAKTEVTGDDPATDAANKQRVKQQISEGRQRIVLQLAYFNAALLLGGGVGGYLLARRTLRPIDEAMQAQNRFAADASHELRTPLAVLKSQTELALLERSGSPADTKRLLQSNLEEINGLTELANGLLFLARDDRAQQILLQLSDVAAESARRFMPLAAKKHIRIARQLTKDSGIMGVKAELQRAIVILLDNAIKYSPPNSAVTLTVASGPDAVTLTVADNGVGMDAATLPYIFERFYRADTARSNTVVPGHGLGLAIAYKIIDEHGGSIQVASVPGEGSTFTITLPRAARK